MIQEFGEMAPIGAQVKADQMHDRAAKSVWLRVVRATEELLSDAPGKTALN